MKELWQFALREDGSIEVTRLDTQKIKVEGSQRVFGPGESIDLPPRCDYETLRAEAEGFIEIGDDGDVTIIPASSGTA